MKAKLSVHMRKLGPQSAFVRTAPGRFFLRDLMDHSQTLYEARPYTKPGSTELVPVFPAGLLTGRLSFQGIRREWRSVLRRLRDSSSLTYLPRREAEAADDFKQLLTYVLVTNGRTLLTYRRGNYSRVEDFLIVEHAGLIFERYKERQYPGGLTKAMWDTLKDDFVNETNSAGKAAIARAVVAYCDGKSIQTFVGETHGTLAPEPRGGRQFYWDTVFIPDTEDAKIKGMTYSEIVDLVDYGLPYKMRFLSQSTKAMLKFLDYLRGHPRDGLWV